jgi:CheY-like chemotaxis protein
VSVQSLILLADDTPNDVLLIKRAFEKAGMLNPVQVVRDGEEVVAYLSGDGQFSNRVEYPLPSLLLLDLKMPRMDGFEVLRWIRHQPSLRALRTVVLTSSEDIYDINRAYELGANSFLVKPMEFEHFTEVSKGIKRYWLRVDKEPSIERPQPAAVPENRGS